jgi:hypothetical protein
VYFFLIFPIYASGLSCLVNKRWDEWTTVRHMIRSKFSICFRKRGFGVLQRRARYQLPFNIENTLIAVSMTFQSAKFTPDWKCYSKPQFYAFLEENILFHHSSNSL